MYEGLPILSDPPDSQNCHTKFEIDEQCNGFHLGTAYTKILLEEFLRNLLVGAVVHMGPARIM